MQKAVWIMIILVFILLVYILSLTGCETMKGFAKDLQNTGDNIWGAVVDR